MSKIFTYKSAALLAALSLTAAVQANAQETSTTKFALAYLRFPLSAGSQCGKWHYFVLCSG